jgi:hypothetical protein
MPKLEPFMADVPVVKFKVIKERKIRERGERRKKPTGVHSRSQRSMNKRRR